MEYKQVIIFITVDSQESANKITQALLEERKAACVNMIPKIESHYSWQGKIESADEIMLIVKTRAALIDDVAKLVKKIHPYIVPEIIAMPIVGGNDDYLKWVEEETKPLKAVKKKVVRKKT